MANGRQLVVMNDADVRMQVLCANKLIVVVYLLYFDVVFLFHSMDYLL